ncbi:MAG: hypothetical protein KGD64_08750 [Candidatus Heimdallarchaeota archaeon]|nr:hypothetical protein [Candidatus Heimdallarchaeota archaeon]
MRVINENVCCASVGIRTDKYEICKELFFIKEDFVFEKDITLKININSICGYVELKNVSENALDIIGKKPETDPENKKINTNPDLYKLEGEQRLEIHLYYKVRVKEMERKQGTSTLESALLDTIQYKKSKYGKTFNTKNYIKFLSKRCNFPEAKLYSGIQKRRVQKRWTKKYFLDLKNENN